MNEEDQKELQTLRNRLRDIADALGGDVNDQRDLCVRAREIGAKAEMALRYRRWLERFRRLDHSRNLNPTVALLEIASEAGQALDGKEPPK